MLRFLLGRHGHGSAERKGSVSAAHLALPLLFLVAACGGSRGGSIPYGVENLKAPSTPVAAAASAAEYHLGTADIVTINVFQVEDLTRDYQVDSNGNISMPLIGSVQANGQTMAELETAIEQRLGERYIRNPDVSVSLKESQRRSITVEGSVRQAGIYPVPGSVTLVQAVALARGTDENANPRRVYVFRQVEGQRMAAAFDLTSIRRGEEPDPTIYAGDIVVVDGSGMRAMWRDVIATLPALSVFYVF